MRTFGTREDRIVGYRQSGGNLLNSGSRVGSSSVSQNYKESRYNFKQKIKMSNLRGTFASKIENTNRIASGLFSFLKWFLFIVIIGVIIYYCCKWSLEIRSFFTGWFPKLVKDSQGKEMTEDEMKQEEIIMDAVESAVMNDSGCITKEDANTRALVIAQCLKADNTLIPDGGAFYDKIVSQLAGINLASCIRVYGAFGLQDASILPSWIPIIGTNFMNLADYSKVQLKKDEYEGFKKFFGTFGNFK